MGYGDLGPKDRVTDDEKFNRYMKNTAKIGAVAISIALAGYAGEHLGRHRFIDVDEIQRQELLDTNQSVLTEISNLPFDEAGRVEEAMDDPSKPGFKNSLAVQLRKEGEKLVIDGSGRHKGFTSQSHTPYDDPASFKLTYPLNETEAHTVPADLLKKVMKSGRMPSEVQYDLAEDRPAKGGMMVIETKSHVTTQLSPSGELVGINADEGYFSTDDHVTGKLKEAYQHVKDELERVG